MRCEVLVNTLWHRGRRPRVGEVIELSPKAARADVRAGLVRVLPVAAAETGDAGDDGQGGDNIPLNPPSKGDFTEGAPGAADSDRAGETPAVLPEASTGDAAEDARKLRALQRDFGPGAGGARKKGK